MWYIWSHLNKKGANKEQTEKWLFFQMEMHASAMFFLRLNIFYKACLTIYICSKMVSFIAYCVTIL